MAMKIQEYWERLRYEVRYEPYSVLACQLQSYEKVKDKLFAMIVAVIMDWRVRSECAIGYTLCLADELGELNPKVVRSVSDNELAELLRRCTAKAEEYVAKVCDNRYSCSCKPRAKRRKKSSQSSTSKVDLVDEWYRENAKYIHKFAQEYDEGVFLNKIVQYLKEHQSDNKVKLNPADIYFLMKYTVPGIGSKKAAMITRDAYLGEEILGYKTVVELLIEKLRSEGIEIVLDKNDAVYTSPFIDVHIKNIISKILGYNAKSSESWEALIDLYYLSTLAFSKNPGIVDLVLWTISRKYCSRRRNAIKKECPLKEYCLVHISQRYS